VILLIVVSRLPLLIAKLIDLIETITTVFQPKKP
jgi:hypothetical protein